MIELALAIVLALFLFFVALPAAIMVLFSILTSKWFWYGVGILAAVGLVSALF